MTQTKETESAERTKRVRTLLHDMNNAFEIIIQASYLVGTLPLDENGRQWIGLLDQGVQQATKINRELRDHIRVLEAA